MKVKLSENLQKGYGMDKKLYDAHLQVLKAELLPALGCTEPGAVAFTAAKAVSVLGKKPEKMEVRSSGNIVKNVKGVIVPNSGGLRGIAPAAILGAMVAKPELELEILDAVTEKEIEETRKYLDTDFCKSTLKEGEGNLYVEVTVWAGDESAKAAIKNNHTNIELLEKNGEIIESGDASDNYDSIDEFKKMMTVDSILEFAKEAKLEDVKETLDTAINYNMAIAEEGLKGIYGAEVGKTLIETYGADDVLVRLKAKAAAGSDARMAGSVMPVVINAGSGNQGITVTVSITEYARGTEASDEKMYRALLIGNLISIHIKSYIGPLSAFCGAVSAASGSSAGITYLAGGNDNQIKMAITNVICDAGGMVCDGAKSSCASKIATSLDAAIMASKMAMSNRVYQSGEGLVLDDVEETIKNIGYMGRVGMKDTDVEILQMMLGNVDTNI